MQTETLSLRLSKAESRALLKRARQEGTSRGKLVRRALASYGISAEPAPRSGYDVIKHLLGQNPGGPSDLSTNPDHLAGYGQ